MKLLYVCEYCDAIIEEVELPARLSDAAVSGLTGIEPGDIMKSGGGQEETFFLTAICDDCRETIYGGPDSTFHNGPVLN